MFISSTLNRLRARAYENRETWVGDSKEFCRLGVGVGVGVESTQSFKPLPLTYHPYLSSDPFILL